MKLVLEKFTSQDFEHYFQLVSDSQVMTMITERAIPLMEAQYDYEAADQQLQPPELGSSRSSIRKLAISSDW